MNDKQMPDYEKLQNAFRALNELGYVTRCDFLSEKMAALREIQSGYPDTPFVFFTKKQRAYCFDTDGNLKSALYLTWDGDGNRIKEEFEKHGLVVEWDGDPGNCIPVCPASTNSSFVPKCKI